MQGLLQESGEIEVFSAIIPLYCTVFGGVLQKGDELLFVAKTKSIIRKTFIYGI